MSTHDDKMRGTGYFLSEDSEFRLRKLRNHMVFLSQLAQPRAGEETSGGGPDIGTAELEVCLDLLAEQVQVVLDDVAWPAAMVRKDRSPARLRDHDDDDDDDEEEDEDAPDTADADAADQEDAVAASAADEAGEAPAAATTPVDTPAVDGDSEAAHDSEPDTSPRFAIRLDQIDDLELRVAKLVALADIVSTAEDVDMARGTLNLLGETLWDHAGTVRELVRSLTDHPLGRGSPPPKGVREARATYGTPPALDRQALQVLH